MNLNIKLIHKVLPQHKIERSGAHAPTNNQRILFQKYEPIRKGSYSSREDKIIKNNWEMFCVVCFKYIIKLYYCINIFYYYIYSSMIGIQRVSSHFFIGGTMGDII